MILIEIVDVGVAGEIQSEELVHKKVRYRQQIYVNKMR